MLCLSGFKLYSRWVPLKGWFPLTRIFSVRTHVKFPCVNEIEAMYQRPRVNVKVERGSTSTIRATFDTLPPNPPWLPLFYLRAFIRKNYATTWNLLCQYSRMVFVYRFTVALPVIIFAHCNSPYCYFCNVLNYIIFKNVIWNLFTLETLRSS